MLSSPSFIGHAVLALGATTLFVCLGLVTRKLWEVLGGVRYFLLYGLSAGLALTAPVGDILSDNGTPDWFSTQLVVAFAVSLAPTWMHWHWLFLGQDQ